MSSGPRPETSGPDSGSLGIGGLDPTAVDVLRFLVSRVDADEETIGAALGRTVPEVSAALDLVERDQLVVRVGDERSSRWAALPPRAGLSTLLAGRRAELAQWERVIDELESAYQSATDGRAAVGMLEVVTGAEAVGAVYAHLLASATDEVLHLAKPPYVDSAHRPAGSAATADVVPGLRLRSVYDTEGFTEPVSLFTAELGSARGGEFRLLAGVPTKLAVFDRRAALLPIRRDDPSVGSLIVHATSLVEMLAALFEALWDRALPLALWNQMKAATDAESAMSEDGLPLGERIRDILEMMAAGLTDDAIARALGVSRRTVQKDVSELADALGARTRFQIAMLATEKGLVFGRASRHGRADQSLP